MDNCTFCKIVNGDIPCNKIWENDDHLAFMDIHPIHAGHVLLIPKKHTDYIFDLEDDNYQEIFAHAKFLAGPMKKVTGAKRIGIAVEGFGVAHVHVHLIPINNLNDLDPCMAKDGDQEELKKLAEEISAQVALS